MREIWNEYGDEPEQLATNELQQEGKGRRKDIEAQAHKIKFEEENFIRVQEKKGHRWVFKILIFSDFFDFFFWIFLWMGDFRGYKLYFMVIFWKLYRFDLWQKKFWNVTFSTFGRLLIEYSSTFFEVSPINNNYNTFCFCWANDNLS